MRYLIRSSCCCAHGRRHCRYTPFSSAGRNGQFSISRSRGVDDRSPRVRSAQQAPAPAQQSSSAMGRHRRISRHKPRRGIQLASRPSAFLGIVPQLSCRQHDEKLPPETVKDKSSAPLRIRSITLLSFPGGHRRVHMDQRSTPQFHQGAAGYARYFWHSAVDQTSENYMVEFIFPTSPTKTRATIPSAAADS